MAGLLAAIGGIPATLVTLGYHLNSKVSIAVTIMGLLGVAMLGRSAKGEDEHSLPSQVAAAGAVAVATTPAAVKAAEIAVKDADEAAKK